MTYNFPAHKKLPVKTIDMNKINVFGHFKFSIKDRVMCGLRHGTITKRYMEEQLYSNGVMFEKELYSIKWDDKEKAEPGYTTKGLSKSTHPNFRENHSHNVDIFKPYR